MRDWDLVQRLGSGLVADLRGNQKKLDDYTSLMASVDRPTIALKSGASLGMWSSTFPNLRKELCALPSVNEVLLMSLRSLALSFSLCGVEIVLCVYVLGVICAQGYTYGVPEICANMTAAQVSKQQYLGMHMRDGVAVFRTTETPPRWLLVPEKRKQSGFFIFFFFLFLLLRLTTQFLCLPSFFLRMFL